MALITVAQVNAWLDPTKAAISSLEDDLTHNLEIKILSKLETRFDTSGWTTAIATPDLVQTVIAMLYAGTIYDRAYSEDIMGGEDVYGTKLQKDAHNLCEAILSGYIELRDLSGYSNPAAPEFWPTNSSTTLADTDPTSSSASPRAFSMGQVF